MILSATEDAPGPRTCNKTGTTRKSVHCLTPSPESCIAPSKKAQGRAPTMGNKKAPAKKKTPGNKKARRKRKPNTLQEMYDQDEAERVAAAAAAAAGGEMTGEEDEVEDEVEDEGMDEQPLPVAPAACTVATLAPVVSKEPINISLLPLLLPPLSPVNLGYAMKFAYMICVNKTVCVQDTGTDHRSVFLMWHVERNIEEMYKVFVAGIRDIGIGLY
ncbi:hypothetical protein EJ02DRAFT_164657 [Clathrospora elynae]|uniref:Uncharacterized protein n=1 Tax=Clathrospora elynae TaxID=706981 RepID=A0A6A5S297_9PLEO|nr:hypothetical protein EJ02DRAFT_164657 [Clathrospora elynae]